MKLRIIALLALSIGLLLSCDKEDKPPQAVVPVAPNLLTAVEITHISITLSWNDRSDNEESFEVEMGQNNVWHLHSSVNADIAQLLVDGLVPSTTYQFRVYAVNSAGRSDPSNMYQVSTNSHTPAPAPTNVTASPLAPTVVKVEWTDTAPMEVHFVIDRRTTSSSWLRVGEVGDNVEIYNDSTCTPATAYYYRVGSLVNNITTWSVDSAAVTTPNSGAPHAPSNLVAAVQVGSGVQLTWVDNSLDETVFHIRRNVEGQFFEIIDSVTANTTTYFDALGQNTAVYNYQVRASNSIGSSAWSNAAQATYDFCSGGAVPICLENYWTYEVDPSSGDTYNARRQVREVAYPGGVDYYLLVEFVGDNTDTLFYWRNFESGLYQDEYPLNGSGAELLLRTPPSAGFWNFQGDSVLVTSASTTVVVQGVTYTGVTIYQRFSRTSNHSIKYYLKPQTVGIIKEEEFIGSSPSVSRELIDSFIRH